MTTETIEQGLVYDLNEAVYHAHPGSLSVTGAKTLLKAPALFQEQRQNPVHKDVFDFGSAAHAMVLGVGAPLAVCDADSWRTKAAQEARDKARAEGHTPILKADHLTICDMAERLSKHRKAMELLSDGKPEVSAFAPDEATGVMRRARFDYLRPDVVVDYKSAASSDPREFFFAAKRFGYHQQDAWYEDIAYDLGHPVKGFVFVVQEKTAPYIVTCLVLPEWLVDEGRALNQQALERFRDCTESGQWPGYVSDDQIAIAEA